MADTETGTLTLDRPDICDFQSIGPDAATTVSYNSNRHRPIASPETISLKTIVTDNSLSQLENIAEDIIMCRLGACKRHPLLVYPLLH